MANRKVCNRLKRINDNIKFFQGQFQLISLLAVCRMFVLCWTSVGNARKYSIKPLLSLAEKTFPQFNAEQTFLLVSKLELVIYQFFQFANINLQRK